MDARPHASRKKRKGRRSQTSKSSELPTLKAQRGKAESFSPPPHPKRRKVEPSSNSKSQPGFLEKYHAGYQEQMLHWPQQPVNTIIKWLKSHSSSLTVADFGCGNATLARNVKNKVFSIDLVSNDPSVIACDMAHTPLESISIDVAVFCLSLMGTNYHNYLLEAKRVLKPSGWLLIAEVRSRFDPNNGGANPDEFCEAIEQLGLSLLSKEKPAFRYVANAKLIGFQDFSNKMFVMFYFKKTERSIKVKSIEWPELKPCIYKKR
ncbi:hypothetical protein ZIOFF_066280 [Zingiber officinale]|uniref:Ribosomal RNA-processing protein 8 n=1 Tax=Zingiber officinale TaxID=94328 RepID=A0A8J5K964_ZINOF|nr:hypothetical protein ZIOFF_066280 [Zingiber officinale]